MAQLKKDEDRNIPPGITLRQVLRGHSGEIKHMIWSSDGRILASSSADNTIQLWDIQTGQALTGHSEIVLSVARSPDGRAAFDLLQRCVLWTPLRKQQGIWKLESNARASTEERAS